MIGTAQARIACVLGMNLESDLKVLHNGKIVYPDPNASPRETSERMLSVSKRDIISRKKPSLVVMGARSGRVGSHAGHNKK